MSLLSREQVLLRQLLEMFSASARAQGAVEGSRREQHSQGKTGETETSSCRSVSWSDPCQARA